MLAWDAGAWQLEAVTKHLRVNPTMVDPSAKARHCTLMLLAAPILADCAPDDVQKRALARYTFLFADAALEWMRRWKNQFKRDPASSKHARACEPRLQKLAEILEEAGEVRDFLAAKRQPKDSFRADDMEGTAQLWAAINPANVSAIGIAAIEAWDALSSAPSGTSIADWVYLPPSYRGAVTEALPSRNLQSWYLAADSSADLRPHTLPVAQGGPIGRRVAEINDVAEHLDVLLRLAPVLDGALIYDWLIRSAFAVELTTLFDLVIGPPPGRLSKTIPLLDLCRADRSDEGKAAVQDLESFRSLIGRDGWTYLRWMRNTIGAHLDTNLTMFEIHQHLMELDYPGIVNLAEESLDFLDEIGAHRQGLKLLLLSEYEVSRWPVDPTKDAPGRPSRPMKPGQLANFFRRFDSPYMIASPSSVASGMIMGISASRKPQPRPKVKVRRKPERYLDPVRWHPDWVQSAKPRKR